MSVKRLTVMTRNYMLVEMYSIVEGLGMPHHIGLDE
jgi:hypothetical protein